jgi:hypothetical protein
LGAKDAAQINVAGNIDEAVITPAILLVILTVVPVSWSAPRSGPTRRLLVAIAADPSDVFALS